ncbi:MAG: FAD:protein FMN transferase [Polaromonas sp.]
MTRRVFLQSTLGLGAVAALGAARWRNAGSAAKAAAHEPALQWRERSLLGFGTLLTLRVAHSDAVQAEQALDAAVITIRHVEDQMSLFNPDSALVRLNRDGMLRHPHPDLLRVFQLAQTVSARSRGAFDVTVQPLWAVFAAAARQGRLPPPAGVAKAQAAVGWQHLAISSGEIRLLRPGMGVTLNGIAQGFAADLVRTRLQALGIEHALINTGEWATLGRPDRERPWLLGLANPRQEQALIARLALDGRSIATSADNECSFSPDRRHHHIFDPHTGYSPTGLASVTVAAASCALADALTKVMFVAGRQAALQLARQWQVDVLVVEKSGQWQATPGLQLQAA